MTGFKNGRATGQITEILHDGRLYTEEEIRTALKAIPKPTKTKGKN